MNDETNAVIEKLRLVRSRTGRLVEAPPEPEPVPEKQPRTPRTNVLIACGAMVVVVLIVFLFLTTQGKVGNGGQLESVLRDFGHVIREVRGPGLVR